MIKSVLRRFKLTYVLNNLFNRRKLQHNVPLYKKYGISKKFYSSVSDKDFRHLNEPEIQPKLSILADPNTLSFLDEQSRKSLLSFNENGIAVLKGLLTQSDVDILNKDVREGVDSGKLTFRYGVKKAVNPHHKIPSILRISEDPRLVSILRLVLDGDPHLIQSISFPNEGSEQRAHTDALHLSTYPRGGMVGVWIALEDIDEENGAILYYFGTHKLPYLMNDAYDNDGNSVLIGDKPYSAYEDMLAAKIDQMKMSPEVFRAKSGDVMIWHANLIHAGGPHLDKSRTRQSLVMHYYNKSCIWFHEISQRPVLAG